jgi:hypothetical protein
MHPHQGGQRLTPRWQFAMMVRVFLLAEAERVRLLHHMRSYVAEQLLVI